MRGDDNQYLLALFVMNRLRLVLFLFRFSRQLVYKIPAKFCV